MKLTIETYANPTFRARPQRVAEASEAPAGSLLEKLRSHKFEIIEKPFGHISSFNFRREVFNSGKWTEVSKVARGLFLNVEDGSIAARGYDKFFNYRERSFNSDKFLVENLKWPVVAYKKYNGFLGLLGYDKKDDKLMFCSKSSVSGTYPEIFQRVFELKHKDIDEPVKKRLAGRKSTLVFEVIDPEADPHIVKYSEPRVVLLDEIADTPVFSHTSYEELCKLAQTLGFEVKERVAEFKDWDSLKKFIDFSKSYESIQGEEGWVFEDTDGYHFKLKTAWYTTWKQLRKLKADIVARHSFSTSCLTSPIMNYFYEWMKKQDPEKLERMSIVDAREEFFKQREMTIS